MERKLYEPRQVRWYSSAVEQRGVGMSLRRLIPGLAACCVILGVAAFADAKPKKSQVNRSPQASPHHESYGKAPARPKRVLFWRRK